LSGLFNDFTFEEAIFFMRKVKLIFPTKGKIADFIITHRIVIGEVDSIEQTLSASLTEDEIIIACTVYSAQVVKMVSLSF
jgi:hypothetical protein